jgi:putative protease
MEEKEIGFVSNYYSKISVAAVELTEGSVSEGDTLHFSGHSTDFQSKVESMQVEHGSVSEAKKGESIGLKVSERVRKGDKVFKVLED